MTNLRTVALVAFGVCAGCFSSGGTVCETAGVCGTGEQVESCAGRTNCVEQTVCGETVACVRDVACDPATRPDCSTLRGAQGPGFEVDTCTVPDTCEELSWCGGIVVCDFPSSPPCFADTAACGCGLDVAREEDCIIDGMLDARCIESDVRDSCDQPVFCRSSMADVPPVECAAATSDVVRVERFPLDVSIELCEPECFFDGIRCDEQVVCWTACPQEARQLEGPTECEDPNDCFFVDHTAPGSDGEPYGRAWCTFDGMGEDRCEAVPSCEPGEGQIALDAPCLDDAVCVFRTLCGATIQCTSPAGG